MADISVSVVIPSYGRHEEVCRAVRSALAQTVPPLEVVVCNDGPDEEKSRLLGAIGDERVRFIEAARSGNASATRNVGVRNARGKWVALLDDDDIWLPDKLKVQLEIIGRYLSIDPIAVGVEEICGRTGGVQYRPSWIESDLYHVDEILFRPGGGVNTSTIVARRQRFLQCPFNEENDNLLEDVEWLLSAGGHGNVVCSPIPVVRRVRVSGGGLGHPGRFEEAWTWYKRMKGSITREGRHDLICIGLARRASQGARVRGSWKLVRELWAEHGLGAKSLVRLMATVWVPRSAKACVRRRIGCFRR
ncbi:glycosyltransferase family A protein [Thioalkalivibrio sp. ALE30]|uniref:glycosyltransferase family 2 protein n=1 Tax=Thioalkalivibrio sp. ALE30 TaxID=1158181 RepID=UPI0018CA516A